MTSKETLPLAERIIERLGATGRHITTAESCTGGLVAAALTSARGASQGFLGGYVTYANSAKTHMIGVPARLIRDFSAVSNQVARAMADGARNTARTDYAVAITGIAGPDGGSEKKPVGLVYVAVSSELATVVIEHRFHNQDRETVRRESVAAALELVWQVLEGEAEDDQAP